MKEVLTVRTSREDQKYTSKSSVNIGSIFESRVKISFSGEGISPIHIPYLSFIPSWIPLSSEDGVYVLFYFTTVEKGSS